MTLADVLSAVGVFALAVGGALVLLKLFHVRIEHRAHYGLGAHGESSPDEKINCPGCGVRIVADTSACEYCGESLPGSKSSGRDTFHERS